MSSHPPTKARSGLGSCSATWSRSSCGRSLGCRHSRFAICPRPGDRAEDPYRQRPSCQPRTGAGSSHGCGTRQNRRDTRSSFCCDARPSDVGRVRPTGPQAAPSGKASRAVPSSDGVFLITEICDHTQPTAECFHVCPQRRDLRAVQFAMFDRGDARCRDSHGCGYLRLGQRLLTSDLCKCERAPQQSACPWLLASPEPNAPATQQPHAARAPCAWSPPSRPCSFVLPGLKICHMRLVALLGDRDVDVVPALPVSSFVASHQQHCPAHRIESEEDPNLAAPRTIPVAAPSSDGYRRP